MRRTPTTEDAKVLLYAGILGHRFAVVVGVEGERRVKSEQNDDRLDERFGPHVDPKVYEKIPYKTRSGGRWRRVR